MHAPKTIVDTGFVVVFYNNIGKNDKANFYQFKNCFSASLTTPETDSIASCKQERNGSFINPVLD